jgi:hypothetical protein
MAKVVKREKVLKLGNPRFCFSSLVEREERKEIGSNALSTIPEADTETTVAFVTPVRRTPAGRERRT